MGSTVFRSDRVAGPKTFGHAPRGGTLDHKTAERRTDTEEFRAAMQALLLVAEHDGPTMFAQIGVMRALNRHVERVFDPSRKDKHWGRLKR
jgi:hypothetical protein